MIVLLSPIGGQAMHGIIEYFKERGDRVIGIDWNPEAIGRHFVDKFHVVPGVGWSGYVDGTLDVIRNENVDVFISWMDQETLFWNEWATREELPAEMAKVNTFNFHPDLPSFCDKLKCARMLTLNGFLVPITAPTEFIGFPCIVKSRISSGSRNVIRIDNLESWKFHIPQMERKGGFIVQQFLSGPEHTVDFFADTGKLVNAVVRQRPEHRGVSLRGSVVDCPAILAIVERIVLRFAIDGLNNIQFIEQEGEHYATDFNPRPSGTIMLSVRAGVDLLHNLIERKEGKPLTVYGGPRELKMVRYLKEHYYD